MTFTLIHPSRGRARQAYNTMATWINKSVSKDIQYIFSLDEDDPQLFFYKNFLYKITAAVTPEVLINPNKNLIQAIERVTSKPENIKGEILIIVSDDFDCPDRWDEQILFEIDERKEFALKVNDGITAVDNPILTLPILSKELFLKLGYVYYPKYTGMFADNDLYEACDKLGAIIHAPHLLFQHKHWVNNMAKKDETYNRHNNTPSWNLGQKLLAERRQRNFDLA